MWKYLDRLYSRFWLRWLAPSSWEENTPLIKAEPKSPKKALKKRLSKSKTLPKVIVTLICLVTVLGCTTLNPSGACHSPERPRAIEAIFQKIDKGTIKAHDLDLDRAQAFDALTYLRDLEITVKDCL